MAAWIILAIGFVLAVLGIASVLRRLAGNSDAAADPTWLDEFSVERYRPMLRLLSEADYEFLASECGFNRAMIRRARAERRRIFRAYLTNLTRDFGRLHRLARVFLLDSPVDRPDLAEKLVRVRVDFLFAVATIRYRLLLHALGIGQVDVRALLGSLEGLRVECRMHAPSRIVPSAMRA